MSKKTSELVLKSLLVINLILLALLFPGLVLISFWIADKTTIELIFNLLVVVYFISGILFLILWPILGGIKLKSVKADRIPLRMNSYDEFADCIESVLQKESYSKLPQRGFDKNGRVIVYIKQAGWWTLNCLSIIRVSELTNEIVDIANNLISDILTTYCQGEKTTDTVNMISVFCVDRMTSVFRQILNSNVQQGFKNGRLIVGISFGGKNMYIANQKDGLAIWKHTKLKKKFLRMMSLIDYDSV